MLTLTEKELKELLVSLFVFAGANDDQGIKQITGATYGDKADTIINAFKCKKPNQTTLSIISKFKAK